MTRKNISEKAATLTAAPVKGDSGDFIIQLITPGWGSSGYYSADVLESAAKTGVFATGTQMFVNHQTGDERNSRPEGDLMGLAAVLQEDAYWDGGALVARAKPFQHWAPVLADMKDSIGVSIRASAEISEGSAEGRNGIIVDELVEAQSVDFVTRAGRGGLIREVIESAHVVEEALTDDRRGQLQRLTPDHSYVRDYDESNRYVYYISYDNVGDESKLLRQTYTITNDAATALEGDPVEVQSVTTYVPVSSAGQTTESQKGNTVQIDDARFAQLTEAAGQVPTLIAERDDAIARSIKAEAALAESTARTDADKRARLALAGAELPALAVERVIAHVLTALPIAEGALDTAVFDTKVTEAKDAELAYIAALAPQGVKGFGASAAVVESSTAGTRVNAWGRTITKEA